MTDLSATAPRNPVFTIKGNIYEIATSAPRYDFAGFASYGGCVTTKRGPHRLRVVVSPTGSTSVDVSELPRSLRWKVQKQLTHELLSQILFK